MADGAPISHRPRAFHPANPTQSLGPRKSPGKVLHGIQADSRLEGTVSAILRWRTCLTACRCDGSIRSVATATILGAVVAVCPRGRLLPM